MFLKNFIGTKPEEDLSMENTNKLLIAMTTCILSFSALEVGFYFLYNKMVMLCSYIELHYNSFI